MCRIWKVTQKIWVVYLADILIRFTRRAKSLFFVKVVAMPTSCRICALLVPNCDKSGTQPETRKLQQVCCRLVACSHQADIRMRWHRLLRLDTNKSASSCQQACCLSVDCQDFLSTGWRQVVRQLAASLQISRCNKSDFYRLAATLWSKQTCYNLLTTCRKPVKPQLAALTVRKVVKDLLQVVPRVCRNCGNMSAKTMEKIVKKAKSTS